MNEIRQIFMSSIPVRVAKFKNIAWLKFVRV